MNYRRAFVPNGYLHIIITSYDRKPIFIENIDILRTAFKNTKTIYEFEIIAICVLPNHIHLILHPNNIEQYPQIISSIKHYFSRNVGQVCPTDKPRNSKFYLAYTFFIRLLLECGGLLKVKKCK